MSIKGILNNYCRRIGQWITIIIPFLTLILIILGKFEATSREMTLAVVTWFLMVLNSFFFLINGLIIVRDFKQATRKKAESGFPIDSLEGYSVVSHFTKSLLLTSTAIFLIVTFSFVLFLLSVTAIPITELIGESLLGWTENEVDNFITNLGNPLRLIIIVSAIGLILIAIGIILMLKIPEKPSFEVGAFLKYYYPKLTPISLDNMLSDSLFAFLDPITRLRFDEWTDTISEFMNPDFEITSNNITRVERAREKILLLFYLRKRMPQILSEDVFDAELSEVIHHDHMIKFKSGEGSGINFTVLNEIFDRLMDKIPEVFHTIDKIVIELTDNLKNFNKNENIWVTVSAPEKVVGNKKPFRILMFALNKDINNFSNKKRIVNFHLNGSAEIYSENLDYNIALDEAEDLEIPFDTLPFHSSDKDVVGVLSRILQIGDAVWFSIERKKFKTHLLHLSIQEEDRGSIFGETAAIDMVRDIQFYIQEYGSKLSALTGLALPAGTMIIQSIGLL